MIFFLLNFISNYYTRSTGNQTIHRDIPPGLSIRKDRKGEWQICRTDTRAVIYCAFFLDSAGFFPLSLIIPAGLENPGRMSVLRNRLDSILS